MPRSTLTSPIIQDRATNKAITELYNEINKILTSFQKNANTYSDSIIDGTVRAVYDGSRYRLEGKTSNGWVSVFAQPSSRVNRYTNAPELTRDGNLLLKNSLKISTQVGNSTLIPSKYETDVDFTLDSSGNIELNAGLGTNVTIKEGSLKLAEFLGLVTSTFRIYNLLDVTDYFQIRVGESGATIISTIDDGAVSGHLNLLPDGDLMFQAASGNVYINRDIDNTTAAINGYGFQVDYDRVGAVTSGTDTNRGIDLDVDVTGAGTSGTPIIRTWGMDIDVVGDNAGSGTSTNTGIDLKVTGADANIGMLITTAGTGANPQLKLSAIDAYDYATFCLADTGDLTIETFGDGTRDSDLILAVDGTVSIAPAGREVSISGGARLALDGPAGDCYLLGHGSNDELFIVVGGDTMMAFDESVDSGITTLQGTLKVKEQSAASADTAGQGQLWIKDEDPCELYFTNDDGDDIQITDGTAIAGGGGTSYHYTMHNWYAGSGTIDYYIPWGGSVTEHSSTSDSLIDDTVWVAPFGGKIVEAKVYSDSDTGSTDLKLSVNGALGSSLLSGGAVNCSSDKTVYTFTCDQNNTFSAGDVIRVYYDGTNYGNQVTFSIKWEIS